MFGWFNNLADDEQETPFSGMVGGPSQVSPWQRASLAGQTLMDIGSGRGGPSFDERLGSLQDSQMQRELMRIKMLQAKREGEVRGNISDIFQRGQQAGQPVLMETASPGFEPGAGEKNGAIENPRNPRQLWSDMYRQAGDYAASVGLGEEAKRYWDRSEQINPRPKFSTDPKVVQTDQGLRFMVLDETSGQPKLLPGVLPPQEVAREVVVDGPNGPQKLLLDKQGNEIKRFDEYVAPQAVDHGDGTTFVRPQAGVSVDKNLSPAERENIAISRGNLAVNQGNQRLSQQRLTLEQQRLREEQRRAAAGRAPDGSELPKGYRWNAEKGHAEPIPGTKPAVEQADEAAARDSKDQGAFMQADRVLSKVDEALSNVGVTTAGVGGALLAKVPGSPAVDLRSDLETIKANLGFAELQAMREASPTGGALGQVAVQELNALQATIASLDPNQSPAALRKSLAQVKQHYNRWKYVMNKARETRGLAPVKSQQPSREASGKVVDFGSLK